MKRILLIQTAFIGDVILATPLIEALHNEFPNAAIDFLLRKGNEGLLNNHPYIRNIIVWDKKAGKYSQMLKIIGTLRNNRYDLAINLQRFLTTGIFTLFSGAKTTFGFSKNPLSVFFSKSYPHVIDIKDGKIHEIDRNLSLLKDILNDSPRFLPKLYPSEKDFAKVKPEMPYITIAPTSVWYTKQYPHHKWMQLIDLTDTNTTIYLLGGKADWEACEKIKEKTRHPKVENVAGTLNFLESAALMKNAKMNYVNDSAPMHIASSMNAPVTAVFCSTIPAFGFGPLSDNSRIIETNEQLNCRPCGLHGFRACPEKHFKCSEIKPEKVLF
jgi:heptosyltransferase-2